MKYPKINTIWKRDEKNKFKIMEGNYSNEEFKNIKNWHVTEKIDGTSIRIMFDAEKSKKWCFSGRTDNAQIPIFLLEYMQDHFTDELLNKQFKDVKKIIIFGEGYGAKIQKGGGLYRKDVSFILFDIWIDGWWLKQEDVRVIAKDLGVTTVPEIGVMKTQEIIDYVKSKPKSIEAEEEKVMEGVVARSEPLMLFRNGKPIMWKLKIKDYE